MWAVEVDDTDAQAALLQVPDDRHEPRKARGRHGTSAGGDGFVRHGTRVRVLSRRAAIGRTVPATSPDDQRRVRDWMTLGTFGSTGEGPFVPIMGVRLLRE